VDRALAPVSLARAAKFEGRRAVAEFRGESGRAKYYRQRRDASAAPLRERVATCGQGGALTLSCRCGRRVITHHCGQVRACAKCARATFARLRRRVVRSLGARPRAARADWERRGRPRGQERRLVLLTLTLRHSGDIATDRERLQLAWERLRAWLWKRIGSPEFVRTWELTPGQRGDGHVHCHVVALWPWLDWRELGREWEAATGGLAVSGGIDMRAISPERGAHYVAKYASKGVQVGEMAPELAAAFLASTYGRRAVTASRKFWVPTTCGCRECGDPLRVVERPQALTRISTALAWDPARRLAMFRRYGPPERWPDWAPESRRHWLTQSLPV
jgi:hypothetical protein